MVASRMARGRATRTDPISATTYAGYARSVLDNAALILFIVGLALFALGDLLWLVRNTFDRPMNLRVTGGLVGSGILLLSLGLVALVADAGS